jgi:hypothetical protein
MNVLAGRAFECPDVKARAGGRDLPARQGMMLYSMHPMPVQRWIAARGGLTPLCETCS